MLNKYSDIYIIFFCYYNLFAFSCLNGDTKNNSLSDIDPNGYCMHSSSDIDFITGLQASEEAIEDYVDSMSISEIKVKKEIFNFLFDFAKGSDHLKREAFKAEIKEKDTHSMLFYCIVVKKNNEDTNTLDIAYKIESFNLRYNYEKFSEDERENIQECLTETLNICEKDLLEYCKKLSLGS